MEGTTWFGDYYQHPICSNLKFMKFWSLFCPLLLSCYWFVACEMKKPEHNVLASQRQKQRDEDFELFKGPMLCKNSL